jgi:hypothetical protein
MRSQVHHLAHIARPADSQVRTGNQHLHGFTCLSQPEMGIIDVIRWVQFKRFFSRSGEGAVARQAFEYLLVLQGV